MIKLYDRIKETSHSIGTGAFNLDGAAAGFSAFNSAYSNGDVLFYAITDGTSYEIGSGVYSSNQLTQRHPFSSSNSNALVNFPNGLKEVYVVYPAKYNVHTASGYSDFQQPQNSGLAFWRGSDVLDYDSSIVWDKDNDRLGILISPEYTLDVSGLARTVGNIVGNSGVLFSGNNIGYVNGVQLEPFLKNILNVETGTDAVFELSGIVNQGWLFKKQGAGTFFAGPPSGCGSPPCPDDYPAFRGITLEDVPDLSDLYVTQYGDGVANNIACYRDSGVIEYDAYLTWDKTFNYLGVNKTTPAKNLDVVGDAEITGDLTVGNDIYVDSIIFENLSVISGAYQAGSGLTLDVFEFNIGNMFKVKDQDANFGWIHQADTVTISGVSGINTYYDSVNKNLQISAGALSGYFEGQLGGGTYTAGSGLTLVGDEFNTAGSGSFEQVILHKTSVPQIVADSGAPNTIVNASGFLTIPTYLSFCSGIEALGSGAIYNKGVLFFTTDANRLYISNGSDWYYNAFTLDNTACGGGGGGPV